MLNIVYRVVVQEGQEQTFKALAEATLIPEAVKLPGCTRFSLFQNSADSREFIFFETWDNEQSVHEYKQQLVSLLGDPRPGEEFPEAMNRLIAEDEDLV
jgi:quinol monooxygenase YgiN